jgi:hypothetical protein
MISTWNGGQEVRHAIQVPITPLPEKWIFQVSDYSRWDKRGSGGTSDELGKPFNEIQRVRVPYGQS